MESVDEQTHDELIHYIFIDGKEHEETVREITDVYDATSIITLEDNIGEGWYGHRVYAACSFLVDADVIIYLDEDNWLEPNHVEEHIKVLEKGFAWSYTLRNIHDKNGKFLCQDNCESLGHWPIYLSKPEEPIHHIDTSCFALRKEVALNIGHAWYGQWGADRQFMHNLAKHFDKFGSTGKHTANYRLDGNEQSVNEEFFVDGNAKMLELYPDGFPWTEDS
jgi:glycosyltransferase involved in cell wall biosynthesis